MKKNTLLCFFLVWFLFACNSTKRINPGQWYRVLLSEEVSFYKFAQIQRVLKSAGFWVRVGEGNEAIYFEGGEICDACKYAQETTFFSGNRAYLYPENESFVVYFDDGGSVIKIMQEKDALDIHFMSSAEIKTEEAERAVLDSLQKICSENKAELNIAFVALPMEGLSE